MADAKKLTKFHIEPNGEEFRLHIEDESGGALELAATREQVDVIVDSLDELLGEDDEADEVQA